MKYFKFMSVFILVLAPAFCFTASANSTVAEEGFIDLAKSDDEYLLSTEIELSNETDFSSVLSISYSATKPSPYKPDNITLFISSENLFTGERDTGLTFDINFLF